MPSNSQRASVGSTYSSKKRASRKPSISSDSEASGAPAKKKIQSKDSDEESNQSESGEDKNSDPEEEEVFEVESIVDHRHRPGLQFRIRWKNYGSDDDTWESVENVRGAKEILEEYKRTHDLSKPKGARLSTASKPKSATKKQRGRALSTEIDASDSEAAPSPKKRKRGSQPKPKPSSGIASLRKNGTGGASKADMASAKNSKVDKENHVPESDAESNTSLPDEEYAKKYLKGTSWENLVQKVRTVKVQTEDNQSDHEDSDENENKVKDLKVCLLLKDQGRMIWCPNATARKKCPQKLLDFYEEHLQFAAVDEE